MIEFRGPVLLSGTRWRIHERDVEWRAMRASGPGGQNVNKVETAIELRFDLANSTLEPGHRARLVKLAGDRLTLDGVLILRAERFRSQERNREDALARLDEMVAKAAIVPKIRIATRPSKGAKERRLTEKAGRSGIKANRGRVRDE